MDVDEYAKNTHDNDILKAYSIDEGMKEGELFPKIRDALTAILKNYPQDSIVVITSNVRFINFLGIKEGELMAFVPDAELLLNLCEKPAPTVAIVSRKSEDAIPSVANTVSQMEGKEKPLPKCPPSVASEDRARRRQIITTRDSVILAYGGSAIVYSDVAELAMKVAERFALVRALGP